MTLYCEYVTGGYEKINAKERRHTPKRSWGAENKHLGLPTSSGATLILQTSWESDCPRLHSQTGNMTLWEDRHQTSLTPEMPTPKYF